MARGIYGAEENRKRSVYLPVRATVMPDSAGLIGMALDGLANRRHGLANTFHGARALIELPPPCESAAGIDLRAIWFTVNICSGR